MNFLKKFSTCLLVIVCFLQTTSCKRGCTDPIAINFDSDAEKDDGSCRYSESNQCWQEPSNNIEFTILDGPSTSAPSKVSVFFKLDDRNQNPVANLTQNNFRVYEQGQNDDCPTLVSISEADRSIENSPQLFNYSTVLLLDLSGSVIDNNLEEIKEASISFVQEIIPESIGSGFDMSIWWFDGGETINNLSPLTDNRDELIAAINSLTPAISNDNTTNLYGAVIQAVSEVEKIKATLPAGLISSSSLVLFTDGRDRAQRETRENAYSAVDNASEDITFFAIGLGDEINPDDLNKFGEDGLRLADDINQVIPLFEEVGKLVTDEAGSYYNFEYCSPIRTGTAVLVIEADFSGQKGFISFEYSGQGFTSGCSL